VGTDRAVARRVLLVGALVALLFPTLHWALTRIYARNFSTAGPNPTALLALAVIAAFVQGTDGRTIALGYRYRFGTPTADGESGLWIPRVLDLLIGGRADEVVAAVLAALVAVEGLDDDGRVVRGPHGAQPAAFDRVEVRLDEVVGQCIALVRTQRHVPDS